MTSFLTLPKHLYLLVLVANNHATQKKYNLIHFNNSSFRSTQKKILITYALPNYSKIFINFFLFLSTETFFSNLNIGLQTELELYEIVSSLRPSSSRQSSSFVSFSSHLCNSVPYLYMVRDKYPSNKMVFVMITGQITGRTFGERRFIYSHMQSKSRWLQISTYHRLRTWI